MRLYEQKDRANNQIYIGLRRDAPMKRGVVKKTVRVTDDIALDFDGRGRLVGIDVSNASRVLGRSAFTEESSSDELVGVAEAAKLFGVKKPNFIRDFANRADFPKPLVELASGRVWLRSEVESYPKRTGKSVQTSQADSLTAPAP